MLVRFTSGLAAAGLILLGAVLSLGGARKGFAQPAQKGATEPEAALEPDDDGEFELPPIAIHGFVSQGAFLSTENDYIGAERATFEFFEAAVNVSSQVTDRLRVGAQLFARDLGPIGNYAMLLDWAYLDYRWRDWLGLRAGRIKMPLGLYNEYVDIDSGHVPILLPQSIYPIRNRDLQLAHTGFSLYGSRALGRAGALDYQAFAGAIFIDADSSALAIQGPFELEAVDSKYVAGGQVMWRTPVEGLRAGASYLHTNFNFHFVTDPLLVGPLIMAGLVPPDFDGTFDYEYRTLDMAVGSLEYERGDLSFSAEYGRTLYDITSTIPDAIPGAEVESENVYGMLAYRFTAWLEASTYYSLYFVEVGDRDGSSDRFTEPHRAYQKDLALSARFDVNDFWLWKLEAHYVDGTAMLPDDDPADPDNLAPHWGLFLVKTTVTF